MSDHALSGSGYPPVPDGSPEPGIGPQGTIPGSLHSPARNIAPTDFSSAPPVPKVRVMTIAEKIDKDYLEAYKTHEKTRLGTLRLLKTAAKNRQVELMRPLTDEDYMDVLAEGAWQNIFTEKPPVFSAEEKRAWLDKNTEVSLGSDAFFPFGDNIERAHRSGVAYVAQPGGSIRDDHVIETCNKYHMAMAFTGIRLFHH